MNEKYKQFIRELSNVLEKDSSRFMMDILKNEGEQDTSDLLDLVLSSHISSLFNCMKQLSSQHPAMNEKVKEFVKSFTAFLSKQDPIRKVEFI